MHHMLTDTVFRRTIETELNVDEARSSLDEIKLN